MYKKTTPKVLRPKGGVQFIWDNFVIQLYWPWVAITNEFGFQIVADSAFRIHPKYKAFGIIILGFGFGFQTLGK